MGYRNTVNLQSINAALTITVMESTEAPAIHVMVIVMESSWEFRWLAVFFSASYGFLIKDLGLPAKPNIIILALCLLRTMLILINCVINQIATSSFRALLRIMTLSLLLSSRHHRLVFRWRL